MVERGVAVAVVVVVCSPEFSDVAIALNRKVGKSDQGLSSPCIPQNIQCEGWKCRSI